MAGFRVKNPEETSGASAHLRGVLDQFSAETCSACGCLISESQSEIVSVPGMTSVLKATRVQQGKFVFLQGQFFTGAI